MAIFEIDSRNATFEDIEKFAANLLQVAKNEDANYETRLTYFGTMTQVFVARKNVESADRLALQIEASSAALAGGLQNLDSAFRGLTKAVDDVRIHATHESRRLISATWALVGATVVLGLATFGLVYYTNQLVRAESKASIVERPVEPPKAPDAKAQ